MEINGESPKLAPIFAFTKGCNQRTEVIMQERTIL